MNITYIRFIMPMGGDKGRNRIAKMGLREGYVTITKQPSDIMKHIRKIVESKWDSKDTRQHGHNFDTSIDYGIWQALMVYGLSVSIVRTF